MKVRKNKAQQTVGKLEMLSLEITPFINGDYSE